MIPVEVIQTPWHFTTFWDWLDSVCDDAAGETCPIWPEHPMTAH